MKKLILIAMIIMMIGRGPETHKRPISRQRHINGYAVCEIELIK